MKWPAVQRHALAEGTQLTAVGQLECAPPPWEPFALAPLTFTHVALALGLMVVFFERAQIRRACVLGSAYATVMVWYAFRRLSAGSRRRAQAKLPCKQRFNASAE
ncbi:hypothetical protein KFE25_002761 [Diacronema lutheri]|uniref:Uncharacterized protein n=2 Tax=Diacronema lutheri TaxID=2081491 RepID=A0A8J5XRW4_DIALT|nr:hypothetical protein KFE25_002761 [Diacronema lutheri]